MEVSPFEITHYLLLKKFASGSVRFLAIPLTSGRQSKGKPILFRLRALANIEPYKSYKAFKGSLVFLVCLVWLTKMPLKKFKTTHEEQ